MTTPLAIPERSTSQMGVTYRDSSDAKSHQMSDRDLTALAISLSTCSNNNSVVKVFECLGQSARDNQFAIWLYASDLAKQRNLWCHVGEPTVPPRPKHNWLAVAEAPVQELTLRQMGEIVAELTAALRARRFGEVSEGLDIAQPNRMCPDAVTAIARTTFSARAHIPAWSNFVKRAADAMLSRGEPEELMMGLM